MSGIYGAYVRSQASNSGLINKTEQLNVNNFLDHLGTNKYSIIHFNLPDEQLYGYTNYGMDTPTPGADASGDCLQGFFHTMDSLSPGLDSDFDESLAVPESLSVIETDKVDNKEGESTSSGKLFLFIY